VNPNHLEAVTPLENIQRGRTRARMLAIAADKPATHNAKLTADQVRAIRADPRGYRRLAKALGLSKYLIQDVKERATYAHID
jgi:thiaminase